MKSAKKWIVAALLLILTGGVIFCGVMTAFGWDFTKLSTSSYEKNSYQVEEAYTNISVSTDTADIIFVLSENSQTSVECYERKKEKHSVTVEDGTLVIKAVDTRKWYEHIGIDFGSSKITVSLPQKEYEALSIKSDTGDVAIPKELRFESIDIAGHTGDVKNYASTSGGIKVKTTTGKIYMEGVFAEKLDLTVSTGNVTALDVACAGDVTVEVSTGKTCLTNLTCQNLTSSGDTGDILLKNVVATQKFTIERDTGDVKFEGSDAAEIFVETDTGDVTGTLLTQKHFITKTDTGDVRVPDTKEGGRCEITTDTGDIEITLI